MVWVNWQKCEASRPQSDKSGSRRYVQKIITKFTSTSKTQVNLTTTSQNPSALIISQKWMHQRSLSSSLRSPVFWAEPVPVEVLLKSESSSWMTLPVPSSVMLRAQSAKTTFSAYSNLNVKLED
ncbi:hypothetical protein EYC80_006037 [Monilinia laxa]|uniref:Uncharacterized protein n=1 Tax=Monilinia laxa TaxID=61186 RepID=A0A5N6KFX6_MONLA|nr:hypothetical protein EYC80_006037 [Monilinia laxa]